MSPSASDKIANKWPTGAGERETSRERDIGRRRDELNVLAPEERWIIRSGIQ